MKPSGFANRERPPLGGLLVGSATAGLGGQCLARTRARYFVSRCLFRAVPLYAVTGARVVPSPRRRRRTTAAGIQELAAELGEDAVKAGNYPRRRRPREETSLVLEAIAR